MGSHAVVTDEVMDTALTSDRRGELPPHFYVGTPVSHEWARRGAVPEAPCRRTGCGRAPGDPIHLRPAA